MKIAISLLGLLMLVGCKHRDPVQNGDLATTGTGMLIVSSEVTTAPRPHIRMTFSRRGMLMQICAFCPVGWVTHTGLGPHKNWTRRTAKRVTEAYANATCLKEVLISDLHAIERVSGDSIIRGEGAPPSQP